MVGGGAELEVRTDREVSHLHDQLRRKGEALSRLNRAHERVLRRAKRLQAERDWLKQFLHNALHGLHYSYGPDCPGCRDLVTLLAVVGPAGTRLLEDARARHPAGSRGAVPGHRTPPIDAQGPGVGTGAEKAPSPTDGAQERSP